MWWLLADGHPTDFTGWLIAALVFTGGLLVSGVTWWGAVSVPRDIESRKKANDDAALLCKTDRGDYNQRLDAKDAAQIETVKAMTDFHMSAMRGQREESRSEREKQYLMFDETLKRSEQHMSQLFATQKEDMIALTATLGVLAEAVYQLRSNTHKRTTVNGG